MLVRCVELRVPHSQRSAQRAKKKFFIANVFHSLDGFHRKGKTPRSLAKGTLLLFYRRDRTY